MKASINPWKKKPSFWILWNEFPFIENELKNQEFKFSLTWALVGFLLPISCKLKLHLWNPEQKSSHLAQNQIPQLKKLNLFCPFMWNPSLVLQTLLSNTALSFARTPLIAILMVLFLLSVLPLLGNFLFLLVFYFYGVGGGGSGAHWRSQYFLRVLTLLKHGWVIDIYLYLTCIFWESLPATILGWM